MQTPYAHRLKLANLAVRRLEGPAGASGLIGAAIEALWVLDTPESLAVAKQLGEANQALGAAIAAIEVVLSR